MNSSLSLPVRPSLESSLRSSFARCLPELRRAGLLFALVSLSGCGGEAPDTAAPGKVTATAKPASAPVAPGERRRTPGEPRRAAAETTESTESTAAGEAALVIGHATPLLPETESYRELEGADAGRLPTGEGIWFTLAKDQLTEAVDRHIKGFELIAQSFGSRFRDSRRSTALRIVESEKWRSPVVRVPKQSKLSFSYMPYLVGMGGYTCELNWRVAFEVVGKGGRSTSVEIWNQSHLLRPPTGGSWRDEMVDLSELAGREGRFVFDAYPTDTTAPVPLDLVAVFANPTVVPDADKRPNLLVISIDTLRKDAISPYGADPKRTPALQSLADGGVVFDQYWSPAPWTLPSYASLFTGEYPSTHGAGADRETDVSGGDAMPTLGVASGIPSLVSHFREQGYRTQSIYSNGHLNLLSGIEKGFDGYLWYGLTGKTAVESFHDWTATLGGQPFFAFVQMTDPHWPYVVPRRFANDLEMPDTRENESLRGIAVDMFRAGVPEEDRADMVELYHYLVQYMDQHVSGILKTLEKRGLADNTLVIFHTDHGEELWDHGEWWHGHTHHAELENVSLIFSWPGQFEGGARIPTPVRAIDVLPTAIDLLGLPPVTYETEGHSFAALLRGESDYEAPPILHEAQLYGPGGDLGLTIWPWRLLIQQNAPWVRREERKADPEGFVPHEVVELYNIEEDPAELHNRADEFPDKVAGMRKQAETLRARARERKVGTSLPAEHGSDADGNANLGVLGYGGDS